MRVFKKGVFLLVVVLILLVAAEGLASWGLFVHAVVTRSTLSPAQRKPARYDPDLGWTNTPSVTLRDLYAPGRHVTINSQGFRNDVEFSRDPPQGQVRILCSGDSFTFGYGVGDEAAWPAALARINDHLEVVNLGVSGYGLDQMYFLFKRSGDPIGHQIHLLAVIPENFARMRYDRFLGFGKPTLKRENGELKADRVPVSQAGFAWPWLTQNLSLIYELRAAQLVLQSKVAPVRGPVLDEDEVMKLAMQALEELYQRHRAKGRYFVIVVLPRRWDFSPNDQDGQRQHLLAELAARGIPTIDLVADLRQRPESTVEEFFIRPGDTPYPLTEGHLSPQGNEFVARRIHAKLLNFPAVATRLTKE